MATMPWWVPVLFAANLGLALYDTFVRKKRAVWWWAWTAFGAFVILLHAIAAIAGAI